MSILKKISSIPADFVSTVRMKPIQALIWFTCWACWTMASMQFYVLPFTLSNVAKFLDVPQSKISEANTTSIAYGGTYGLIMAMVLEAIPERTRGVVAGSTQQGFSAGYLIASGLHLAMGKFGWQALFWLTAGITVPVIVIRIVVPHYSLTAQAVENSDNVETVDARAAVGGNLPFLKKVKYVVRYHPKAFIYACCLTACFNTMDLYPTFLVTQRKFDIVRETWVTVILQVGGVLGGIVGGFLSHKISPKWVAAVCALLCAPWLPLWVLPREWNLLALGAFWLQFFYGCAIRNLGNVMQQLCPHPGMRAAFTGVAYNIGNAVSAIAPTIETALGERFPLSDGTPDYARTQMILVGIVIFLLVVTLASMPLKSLNKHWDEEDPNADIPHHDIGTSVDAEMGDVASSDRDDFNRGNSRHFHIEKTG